MGALHQGHLSLIEASRSQNALTVCSIFVNPTQFNNADDLARYPRNMETDIRMLLEHGCDVLFHPDAQEMYHGNETIAHVDYGTLTNTLEGHFRPGHFDGVVAIVEKLFRAVEPDHAYFGQKDYQQCAVVRELISRKKLPLELHICPTQREADGLAMSSRNTRLNAEERKAALAIPQALSAIKAQQQTKSVNALKQQAVDTIHAASPLLRVEYVEIADAVSLEPLSVIDRGRPAVALVAAWCGNVRLIDNQLLTD